MRYLVSVAAIAALTVAAFTGGARTAQAEEIEWVPTLKKGLEQAKRSGRSVLYITLWNPGT